MRKQPLLTIVVPTYNREKLLLRLLQTIEVAWTNAGMEPGELEVLVSDNASTDATWSVLERIQADSKFLMRLNRNAINIGFIGNIMEGFHLANGDWIMVCGDDDEMHEQGLERIIKTIASRRADVYSFWTESNPSCQWVAREKFITLRELAGNYYYFPGNCGLAVASGALVRQAAALLRARNVKVSTWVIMDVYGCAAALSKLTLPVCLSPEVIARHPHHGSSTSLSSYYLFEVTHVGLIRSAVNVDNCTSAGITPVVIRYWLGGFSFATKLWDVFRVGLLNDLPEDRVETMEAAARALRSLPNSATPYCRAVWLLQKLPLRAAKMVLLLAYFIRNPLTAPAKFRAAMATRAENRAKRRRKLADSNATGIYTSGNFA